MVFLIILIIIKTKLFSAANLVEPGVFDWGHKKYSKDSGLSFFMLMPLSSNEINAFDEMMMVFKENKTSLKAGVMMQEAHLVFNRSDTFVKSY